MNLSYNYLLTAYVLVYFCKISPNWPSPWHYATDFKYNNYICDINQIYIFEDESQWKAILYIIIWMALWAMKFTTTERMKCISIIIIPFSTASISITMTFSLSDLKVWYMKR